MVALASATTACTTHCATRGSCRCGCTSRQLVAYFESPRETRKAHRMYVCVCVDTLHPLPARQQFDSRPLAVPVQDWALRSTSSPLSARGTATPLRFANVKVLALCLNNTKTKRDLLNPCRPVIESFILFSLKKQTSWHVHTVLVSVLQNQFVLWTFMSCFVFAMTV